MSSKSLPAPGRLLTTEELAERFRTTPNAIYKLRGAGPKRIKVGRRWLYPESAVDAWLSEQAA